MNRIEFMTELAALLQDVPQEERRDAMKYYNDYFDDAGEENEQQVIAELGDPAKVAATIKADLGSFTGEQGEYTEKGYQDSRFENKEMPAGRDYQEGYHYGGSYQDSSRDGGYDRGSYQSSDSQRSEYTGNRYQDGGYAYENSSEQTPPKTNHLLKICLIILLIIVGAPIIIPVVIAAAALVSAAGVALFAVFFSLVIASVAVAFAGVCVFIAGLVSLIPEIAVGLALIGTGLILTAVGIVATVASVRLCVIVLPGICRGFIWLCRWPFQRKAVA